MMGGSILAEVDRLALEDGLSLRLLSALEVLEARREGEALSAGERERALCCNACLIARALELEGEAVFPSGEAVLAGLRMEEIASLAKRWGDFNRSVNPSPNISAEEAEMLKKKLSEDGAERLRWRVLRTFGALPTEGRAREMKDRDYLWCALNLMLDDEEMLDRLCPSCRSLAEGGCCPSCGGEVSRSQVGVNLSFDLEKFEQLKFKKLNQRGV